jgi:hypothetical protein
LLVRKVMVDGRFDQTRRVRDIADRNAAKAALGKQDAGGIQNSRTPIAVMRHANPLGNYRTKWLTERSVSELIIAVLIDLSN